MEKLTIQSKLFHDLLYMIWLIAGYYEKVFGYTVPEKAADVKAEISRTGGLTRLYFHFPKIQDFNPCVSVEYMTSIFNQHLYYDLLPAAGIPKFRAGNRPYDVYEAFLVESILIGKDDVTVSVVYMDSLIAYDYVHGHRDLEGGSYEEFKKYI